MSICTSCDREAILFALDEDGRSKPYGWQLGDIICNSTSAQCQPILEETKTALVELQTLPPISSEAKGVGNWKFVLSLVFVL